MKRTIVSVLLLSLLLASSALFLSSCAVMGGGSSGGLSCFGEFSWPWFLVIKNASFTSNPYNPITGEAVSDAVISITNDTTGATATAVYVPVWGGYTTTANFPTNAGDLIKLSIVSPSGTITGSSTKVPNSSISSLAPATGATVSLPATVSWTYTAGTSDASYTWVILRNATGTAGYQVVVPSSQTSITVNSSNITSGTYNIWVGACNAMSLTGAGSGSVIYVTGGTQGNSYGVNF